MASQDYTSTLILTDEQKSSLSQLEPAQTEKTATRRDISEISEKCEVGLNPRFSSVFAEDPPAERLSSSLPRAGSAPGSTHVKNRDEEIGKASKSQSTRPVRVRVP